MKCSNCGVEWTVPATFTSKIDVCPFCGKSMQPEKPKFNSLDDILSFIKKEFGKEVLGDCVKLQSLVSDLAPHLTREKRMLHYFAECNGNSVFVDALEKSCDEAKAIIRVVADQMENKLLVRQDAVQQVCGSFWRVIGGDGKAIIQIINSQSTPLAPSTREKPIEDSQRETCVNEDDRLLKMVENKIKPSQIDCQRMATRGKELLNYPQRPGDALKMIRYAAQFGNQQAAILLGDCYAQGNGLKKDADAAEGYYQRAAVSGNNEAQYKLGVLFYKRRKYIQAKEWLQKSADAGYAPAIDYIRYYIL